MGGGLVESAKAAHRGGVSWMLLRAKSATTTQRVALGRILLAELPGVTLSVHGDREAARILGGLGVHSPSADLAKPRAETPGPSGVSCHNRRELQLAAEAGYDYCFLSPVFAPLSKEGQSPPLGVEGFRDQARAATLPVYALGGITPQSVPDLARSGASGVAAIGGLFLAPDITATARQWVEAVKEGFGRI